MPLKSVNAVRKIIFLLSIGLGLVLTACAQIEDWIPVDLNPISETQPAAQPSVTPTPITPTATVPTPTPTISPIPSLTNTPRPTRTPLPTFTPSVTIPPIVRIGPDNFPDYVNPLTGLTASNPLLLNRRPIVIKIPNYPHNVRPQSGISLADHVFELYLEAGLTRFAAVFYGNEAVKVGPIRSARISDEHLMRMYNAIFVFNGADKRTLEYYDEQNLNEDLFVVERECPPLCRDATIPTYNNLFGNTTLISNYITNNGTDNSRYDLATNYFYSLGGHGVITASRIYVKYSYANYAYWEYDPIDHRYLRYQGSVDLVNGQEEVYTLLTDALTNQPIAADNVIILFVPHEFYYKSSDTEMFKINMVDSGKAYVFRNGKGEEAVWQRTAENKPLSILLTDGSPYPLKPGVTFFQVIHTTSQFIQNGQTWTYIFERPEE